MTHDRNDKAVKMISILTQTKGRHGHKNNGIQTEGNIKITAMIGTVTKQRVVKSDKLNNTKSRVTMVIHIKRNVKATVMRGAMKQTKGNVKVTVMMKGIMAYKPWVMSRSP